ncbi:MAG TPA: nitrilase-related carbon-nitrogen hydrolase [Blastocatellia bacterium]|nr:nitrilase-related carbon-nitrogen hydrolase [Blastocatellia bacterium]
MSKTYSRPLWIAGTILSIGAVHTNWNVPLAAWLFPVLLLRYLRLREPKAGIARVQLALTVSASFWLITTGLIGVPVAVFIFLFLSVLQTVPFALDRLFARRLSPLIGTLVFPASRVAAEYLFVLIAGFGSWGTFGGTQHQNLALIQTASVTGVYGVSFVVAWFSSMVNWAWDRDFRWPAIWKGVIIYACFLLAVLGAGCVRLLFFPPTSTTVRVAGIGPSRRAERAFNTAVGQAVKRYWNAEEVVGADPVRVRDAFAYVNDDLIAGTKREAKAGAKLILWPETQARVLQKDLDALLQRVKSIALDEDVFVNMAFALYSDDAGIRNVAMLITPSGDLAWTYDKSHPTPMEPMKPGPGDVPTAMSPYGRLSTVICYDADFPDLMQQAVRKGADLMMVPADDWWGFEHLHAENVVLRAVENGYSIVRQSSHGVSTAVDRHGRIIASINYFATDDPSMVAAIPLQPRIRTFYSRHGDVFAWLCIFGAAVLVTGAIVPLPRRLRRALDSGGSHGSEKGV